MVMILHLLSQDEPRKCKSYRSRSAGHLSSCPKKKNQNILHSTVYIQAISSFFSISGSVNYIVTAEIFNIQVPLCQIYWQKTILVFTQRYSRPWSPAFVLNVMLNSLLLCRVFDYVAPEWVTDYREEPRMLILFIVLQQLWACPWKLLNENAQCNSIAMLLFPSRGQISLFLSLQPNCVVIVWNRLQQWSVWCPSVNPSCIVKSAALRCIAVLSLDCFFFIRQLT